MKKEVDKINMNIKKSVSKIVIVLLTVVFIGMFITKGAYFRTDIIGFNFLLILIGLGYIGYSVYENIKEEQNLKFSVMDVAVVIYSLSYSLPIIFNTVASRGDSFLGAIKYIGFGCTYFCVKKIFNLERKERLSYLDIFFKIFAAVSTVFCILGLDELSIKAFSGILKLVGIKYVAADFRLSSIFQYANASAIFIALGSFIMLYLCMNAKNIKTKVIYLAILYLHVMSLFLTQSRTAIALLVLIALTVVFLIKDKFIRNKVITMELFTIGYTAVFYTVLYQFVKLQTREQILILFTVSGLIYTFITGFYLVFAKEFKKVIESKKYIITFSTLSVMLLVGIVALMFGLKTNLVVTQLEKRKVKVDGKKDIPFTISLNASEDFRIAVDGLDKSHITVYTKEYNKNDLKGKEIKDIVPKNDQIKYIEISFMTANSNYEVNKILVGNNNITPDYLLIPYDLVYKLQDVLIGSSSFKERMKYYRDGLNFAKENLIIGKGAYTFRNMYQYFQTEGYISKEAHSYLLDILLDTGLVGFISYIVIIGCCIKKLFFALQTEKECNIRYANLTALFSLLVLHSTVDLDFSFNIILMVFAVIIANIPEYKEYELKYGTVKSVVAISLILGYFIIATRMYIADNILNSVQKDKSRDFSKKVKKMKIARMLDNNTFEISKEYIDVCEENKKKLKTKALKNTITKSEKQEVTDLLIEIRKTSLDIYAKNPYNKKALEEVAKAYIRNFLNYATLDHTTNYDKSLETAFRAIDDLIKAGSLNVNNYHMAVSLWHNIYVQLEFIEKELNVNISESILKAKENILNVENIAKNNFKAKNQIYYDTFTEPFKDIIDKYKEAEMI